MEHFAEGSPTDVIDATRAAALLDGMLAALGGCGAFCSCAGRFAVCVGGGELTALFYEKLKNRRKWKCCRRWARMWR